MCRLKKSLYGLNQAPLQWYWKFDSFMTDQGYHKTQAYHYVFVKKFNGGDLEVEQLDVKTTFLHDDLEEEIYMQQPEVFFKKGKKHLV